ncbi:MAG TPA: DUF6056 family protein, partial [Burkholderiaceae bacterium]
MNSMESRIGCICLACFFVMMLAIAQRHGLEAGNYDDQMYASVRVQGHVWRWLQERYQIWSGRTVIDAATIGFSGLLFWWRLLTAVLATALLGSMAAMLGRDLGLRALPFLIIACFLTDLNAVRAGVWWYAGSFNYLWPAALAVLALRPFLQPSASWRTFVMTLPAAVYGASQEQTGLLLLMAMGLASARLLRHRRLSLGHGLLLLSAAMTFAWVVTAPGSAARIAVNVKYWFPE